MRKKLINIGRKSKKAFLHHITSKKKDKVLKNYFELIYKNRKLILSANKKDLDLANKKKLNKNFIHRLVLKEKKF